MVLLIKRNYRGCTFLFTTTTPKEKHMHGVRYNFQVAGAHHNEHHLLQPAFNGDLDDFIARQVKCVTMHRKATLSGHFHSYRELHYMWAGQAEFTLYDVDTKERETFVLYQGSRILIPPMIAHKAVVNEGSTLISITEAPYISPEHNDLPFEF